MRARASADGDALVSHLSVLVASLPQAHRNSALNLAVLLDAVNEASPNKVRLVAAWKACGPLNGGWGRGLMMRSSPPSRVWHNMSHSVTPSHTHPLTLHPRAPAPALVGGAGDADWTALPAPSRAAVDRSDRGRRGEEARGGDHAVHHSQPRPNLCRAIGRGGGGRLRSRHRGADRRPQRERRRHRCGPPRTGPPTG